ncbi:MAG: thioesterase [Desulfobacterales bacterium GWB2_56_26]|nr:MAG: thioesterase [Desulfobacterales bacterium GWB2_56_26]
MESGAKGECIYTVQHKDLASAVAISSEDDFPDVLATSRMIALMEISAARLMKPMLQPGELSVGVSVDIKHFAPTPVGEEVKAVATFTGQDGKLFLFDVEVSDRAGKVASGRHSRAIVATARLVEGARTRMEKAGKA